MSIAIHDRFRVIHRGVEYEFEAAEEGGYVARVPAYPSAPSQGETFEEALDNVIDALAECIGTVLTLALKCRRNSSNGYHLPLHEHRRAANLRRRHSRHMEALPPGGGDARPGVIIRTR